MTPKKRVTWWAATRRMAEKVRDQFSACDLWISLGQGSPAPPMTRYRRRELRRRLARLSALVEALRLRVAETEVDEP